MAENVDYQSHYIKMTQTPVWRLIAGLVVPSTVSVLISNLYSMADTYFVSTLGVNESGATGVVYALMAVIQAIGYTFGTGAGSLVSRLLGSGDLDKAKKVSATAVYYGFAAGLIFAILGSVFIEPLMYVMGSTDLILPHAVAYGQCILIAVPVMICSLIFNNLYRYEGKATFGMIGLLCGGLFNILGDYVLITYTDLGVLGAGIATCVSQYISFVILLVPFLRRQSRLSISPAFFDKDIKVIAGVIFTGCPSLIRQGLFGVSSMALNHCAAFCGGEAAISAMSIVNRVINVIYSMALGIGHSFQPVGGFNYGAKRYDRTRRAMLVMMFGIMITMAVLGAVTFIFSDTIVTFFRPEEFIISVGGAALRAQCVILPLLGIQICANMSHQITGHIIKTAVLASFRSGLFYIPVIFIAVNAFGTDGLIYSQPAADLIGTIASLPFVVILYRQLGRQMLSETKKEDEKE